jgi:C4-dicarboxylate transporter DctQ subunit
MLDRIYVRTIEILVMLAFVAMVGIGFVSTVLRGVPGWGGLYWAEEIIRYACIWMVFLASGLTIRYAVHFRVDILFMMFPVRGQRWFAYFAFALMIWFQCVLIWFGGKVTLLNMEQQSTSLEFPMGYVYAALPVGGMLMLFETIRLAIIVWRGGDQNAAAGQVLVD